MKTIEGSHGEEFVSTIGTDGLRRIGLTALLNAVDAHAIVVVTDMKGVITYVNEHFCTLSKYSSDELIGKTHRVVNSGYHSKAFWRKLWACISSGKVWKGTIRNRAKDGSLYWVETTIYPVKGPDGEIQQYLALRTNITSEKSVEKDLRLSQRQIEESATIAKLGTWELDVQNEKLSWSDMAKIIHEVPAGFELTFESVIRFYDKEWSRERISDCLRDAIKKGTAFDTELLIETQKGTRKWIRAKGAAEFVNGQCIRLFGIFQDIDAEKRQCEDRERLSSLLRNVLNSATEFSIIATDTNGLITVFSKGSEKMLGYRAEEMIGKRTPEIIHRADEVSERASELSGKLGHEVSGFRTFVELSDLTGSEIREWTYVRKDGECVPVVLAVTPMKDSSGELIGYIGIAHDVSERQALIDRVKHANERLSLATSAGGVGIWDWDIANNELLWDDQMYLLYGINADSFAGVYEAWVAGVHPDDAERSERAVAMALRGERRFDTEFRVVRPNGEIRHVRALGYVQFDESEIPLRMLGTNWDITEVVQRREDLARLAEESKQASKAKSQFLANMSHEIRTPMNGIIGMTSLLLDTKGLDEEQMHFANVIRSSGEALLALVNDILDFSKVEAGKLELEVLDFRLRDLLDDFTSILSVRAKQKGLDFNCRANQDVPNRLVGDPGRLRQVLLNLAGNAIKFTEKGSVDVVVSLVSMVDTTVVLKFRVEDTGIGIPAEKRSLLFNEFSQADSSTTRVYGGSGLGLAISKQLTQLMDGEIGVESVEGEGSTFWVTAQFGVGKKHENTEATIASLAGSNAVVVRAGEETLEFIERQFEEWAIEVIAFSKADAAVDYMNGQSSLGKQVKYVFIEGVGSDRFVSEFARTMRSDRCLHSCKLVLCSKIGERGDVYRLSDYGYDGFVSIPIRQSELLGALVDIEQVDQGGRKPLGEIAPDAFENRARRILLVEDNSVNQIVATGVLKKFGLSVDVANNGFEAIEALKAKSYDLVLMDIQMPRLDGKEASERIRNGEAGQGNKRIPIVALTAHARQEDRVECIQSGMDGYVSKPIELRELYGVLDMYLPLKSNRNGSGSDTRNGSSSDLDFDREYLLGNVMEDLQLAELVVRKMIQELDDNTLLVEDRSLLSDAEKLIRSFHSIKGMSANCGCKALFALSGEMEDVARDDTVEKSLEKLPEFRDACARARPELEAFLAEIERT